MFLRLRPIAILRWGTWQLHSFDRRYPPSKHDHLRHWVMLAVTIRSCNNRSANRSLRLQQRICRFTLYVGLLCLWVVFDLDFESWGLDQCLTFILESRDVDLCTFLCVVFGALNQLFKLIWRENVFDWAAVALFGWPHEVLKLALAIVCSVVFSTFAWLIVHEWYCIPPSRRYWQRLPLVWLAWYPRLRLISTGTEFLVLPIDCGGYRYNPLLVCQLVSGRVLRRRVRAWSESASLL